MAFQITNVSHFKYYFTNYLKEIVAQSQGEKKVSFQFGWDSAPGRERQCMQCYKLCGKKSWDSGENLNMLC